MADRTQRDPSPNRRKIVQYGTTNTDLSSVRPTKVTSPAQGDIKVPSTSKHVYVVCSVIWLANFVAALDSTIVTTLTEPLMKEFDSPSLISWLGASFFIANAISQPICGQLVTAFSRRSGLLFSAAIFLVGNLVCGLAFRDSMLISGRAISGFGGGSLVVISTVIISDLVPGDQRGYWQGITNIAYGSGHGFGGFFGGLMSDTSSWRHGFLSIVPTTAAFTIAAWIVVPKSRPDPEIHASPIDHGSRLSLVDVTGCALISAGLFGLLCGLNLAAFDTSRDPWIVVGLLVVSALLVVFFILYELYLAKNPVLPVVLLKNPLIATTLSINFFGVMSASIAEFYLPIYFELQDRSSALAGSRLAPLSFGAAFGSFVVGVATSRFGRYNTLTNALTLTITTASIIGFLTLELSTSWSTGVIWTVLSGLGFGGMMTATLVIILSNTASTDHPNVTSMLYAFRAVGGASGVALGGWLFRTALNSHLRSSFSDRGDCEELVLSIMRDISNLGRFTESLELAAQESIMRSIMDVFRLDLLACVVSFGSGILGLILAVRRSDGAVHQNTLEGNPDASV